MSLRRSCLVHQIPVGNNRILIVHALTHMRLPADPEVGTLLTYFDEPHDLDSACRDLTTLIPFTPEAIERAIAGLVERKVLTDKTPEEEMASAGADLAPTHGRDPGEMLELYRRQSREGVKPYWSAAGVRFPPS
jgi:hypothetical protein